MATENLLDCLRAIKARLATKETWCQYAPAVTKTGSSIFSTSPEAYRWCLLGALEVEVSKRPPLHNIDVMAPLSKYQEKLFTRCTESLQCMNDELGFDAVHKLLDHAIADLETKINKNDNQSTGQNSTSP